MPAKKSEDNETKMKKNEHTKVKVKKRQSNRQKESKMRYIKTIHTSYAAAPAEASALLCKNNLKTSIFIEEEEEEKGRYLNNADSLSGVAIWYKKAI